MSNRNADKARLILGKRLWEIEGSFVALAGAGTVTASTVRGFGFGYAPLNGVMTLLPRATQGISSTPGIVRTGTGLYTITLEDSYIDYVTCAAWLMPPGGTVNDAAIETAPTNFGVSGLAPTFTLVTYSGATGTAADLGTTFTVCFRFVLRDSTVQYNKP
jgi:hypothetical protein